MSDSDKEDTKEEELKEVKESQKDREPPRKTSKGYPIYYLFDVRP